MFQNNFPSHLQPTHAIDSLIDSPHQPVVAVSGESHNSILLLRTDSLLDVETNTKWSQTCSRVKYIF